MCLITDRRTGQSKCFAFIYFMALEDAIKAYGPLLARILHLSLIPLV